MALFSSRSIGMIRATTWPLVTAVPSTRSIGSMRAVVGHRDQVGFGQPGLAFLVDIFLNGAAATGDAPRPEFRQTTTQTPSPVSTIATAASKSSHPRSHRQSSQLAKSRMSELISRGLRRSRPGPAAIPPAYSLVFEASSQSS